MEVEKVPFAYAFEIYGNLNEDTHAKSDFMLKYNIIRNKYNDLSNIN